MSKKLRPRQQAAKKEFAALEKASAARLRKMNNSKPKYTEQEVQATLAKFKYEVPAWLAKLLDEVIESMMLMDVDPIPNCDPESAEFRDHFFLELVLRLTFDVPFETTAELFATAIGEASEPYLHRPHPKLDAGTQRRYDILEKALWAFCKAQRAANDAKAA
jgi:hypothetical protein